MKKMFFILLMWGMSMPLVAQQQVAVELKVDKKVIHPELLGYNDNTSLLEVLQILPELINRSTGYLLPNYNVELDGKGVGDARDVVLNHTKLLEIDCIEVSTNPTASEQRNGQGGKINVKLKKLEEGLSGSVNVGVSSLWAVAPAAYIGYKKGKLELRSAVMLEYDNKASDCDYEAYSYRRQTDLHRTLFLRKEKINEEFLGETAKLNLKYSFTNQDVLNIWAMQTGSYGRRNAQTAAESHTQVEDTLLRLRFGSMDDRVRKNTTNISAIAQYEHTYTAGGKLTLEATYNFDPNSSYKCQSNQGEYYQTAQSVDENKWDRSHTVAMTVKTKHPLPIPEGHLLEMEVGTNVNWNKQDVDYSDTIRVVSVSDAVRTMQAQHDIWYVSPYVEWSYRWGGLDAKLGLRYQYQRRWLHYQDKDLNGVQSHEHPVVNHDATANLNIAYHFNDQHHLRMMAARNLVRPSDQQVYPGVVADYSQKRVYIGNSLGEVRNTVAYSVQLDYVFHWAANDHQVMLNTGLRYLRMTDMVNVVALNKEMFGMTTVTYQNGGNADVGTLDLSLYYRYQQFSFAFANNYYLRKGCFYYNFSVTPVYAFPHDWTLSGRMTYNSRVEQGQSYLGDCFYAQLRLNKTYRRWMFYVELDDIFDYHTIDRTNYSANEYELRRYDLYKRSVILGVSYKF